ncbi:hypothetical protein VTO42DRAFT_4189 [Malbranchea cinnamomea]
MQYKALSLFFLSASTALAAVPAKMKRQDSPGEILDDFLDDITDPLDEIRTWFEDLPIPSDLPNLITYVPEEIRTFAVDDPLGWGSSLLSSLYHSNTPDWFSELPESARDELNSIAAQITDFADDIADVTATGTDAAPTATGTEEADPSSSNFAARPTAAVMAGLAGAAGVLGLAIAL